MLKNTREPSLKCLIFHLKNVSSSNHFGLRGLLWGWIFLLLSSLSTLSTTLPFTSYKILLNQASFNELLLVPGLGEKRAFLILQRRESQGPFKHLAELAEIKGMGPLFIRRIIPYVRIL